MRNPVMRAQRAFSADVDPRTLIAAWPAFAQALHTAAAKIDVETAQRFRRLAASAGTVSGWNQRANVGSGQPDPGVLALAKEISEATPIKDRAQAAARLDATAWAATGTLMSRVQDHLGELLTSRQADMPAAIRDLRRARATIAAANILSEVDHGGQERRGVFAPLARWELEATRAITKAPTTLLLWMVTVRQELNSAAMIEATEHHYRHGGLDGLETERVLEALDSNRQGWAGLRDGLEPLAIGTRPPAASLVAAGEVAGAHLADLRHGSARQLRQNLSVFLASSVNIAATTTAVIESGHLHGPAAAVNRRALQLKPSHEGTHVGIVALQQRRIVPVGEVVQADLVYQSMSLRDSLEWTGNVAKAGPDPWQVGRSAQDAEQNRSPVERDREPAPTRDI